MDAEVGPYYLSALFFPFFPDSQMVLISYLCSTLVSNANMKNEAYSIQTFLLEVCSELAPLEPEFILKVL